jgi:hypothetical protein
MGSIISKDVFEYLLDHMLDIHRKKIGIISGYSLDYDSYTNKLSFLNSYIKGIEAFLESALVEGDSRELPFVILGSIAYVRNNHNNERAKIKITLPKEQPGIDEKDVDTFTCFSDVGYAILLKHTGEHVQVGHSGYTIEKVAKNTKAKAVAD